MQVSGDNGQMRKITDVNTKESAGRALFNAFLCMIFKNIMRYFARIAIKCGKVMRKFA